MESSHSGLVHRLGKAAYRKVSRVQIPHSPHIQLEHLESPVFFAGLFNLESIISIYNKINYIELKLLEQQLSSLSCVLLGVSPAIFVFTVTLLGTAIDNAKNEENAARENAKADVQKEIDELEIALDKARKDGDTTELNTKMNELKSKKLGAEAEIISIKKKYSRINLFNTVLIPCISFILVIMLSAFIFFLDNIYFRVIIFTVQFLLLCFGIFKLYISLSLVQIISANKKEGDYLLRLKESIKAALEEHRQNNKEEAVVEFVDKSFPLNVVALMELAIKFRVKLIKGATLKNSFVWFYIPDGFELINPSEAESWRQPMDSSFPNMRTVQIALNTLNIGPATPGTLKIKTPQSLGKYIIKYRVRAEGYSSAVKELTIFVG